MIAPDFYNRKGYHSIVLQAVCTWGFGVPDVSLADDAFFPFTNNNGAGRPIHQAPHSGPSSYQTSIWLVEGAVVNSLAGDFVECGLGIQGGARHLHSAQHSGVTQSDVSRLWTLRSSLQSSHTDPTAPLDT